MPVTDYMMTSYEWDIEEIDQCGDIHDHNFFDKLPNNTKKILLDESMRLVLVYYKGNDAEGEVDRDWAYVVDGKLPKTFEYNGRVVPARFHKELAKILGD